MLNNEFMKLALKRALEVKIDIPVCAIIVKNNDIISIEVNEKEKNNLVTSHAEILALQKANKFFNSWRLDECEMYVTLEPCPMCAAAIINSRIKNLYFSSYDVKYGAFSTSINLKKFYNSKINIYGGIMEEKGNELLKTYFERLR